MSRSDLSFLGELSDDDRLLVKRTIDRIDSVRSQYCAKFSFFLDERQRTICEKVLAAYGCEDYGFFGGYDGAERTVLGIFPPFSDDRSYPTGAVTFTFRKADTLSHRDILGCIMSRRVARETVGDILVSSGKALVFAYNTIITEISSVEKIGRVGVKAFSGADDEVIANSRTKFREIKGTVASLRIDCVMSMALGLSREKTSALIKSKGVEVNHITLYSADRTLSVGTFFPPADTVNFCSPKQAARAGKSGYI